MLRSGPSPGYIEAEPVQLVDICRSVRPPAGSAPVEANRRDQDDLDTVILKIEQTCSRQGVPQLACLLACWGFGVRLYRGSSLSFSLCGTRVPEEPPSEDAWRSIGKILVGAVRL